MKHSPIPFALVFVILAFVVAADSHRSLAGPAPFPPHPLRSFTFADRVAYQRAIEQVYWQHRVWPAKNPKPSFDEVVSTPQMEMKVADYLRKSDGSNKQFQPITPPQLQAEMERMASQTQRPEVLRELFEALGNNPTVIAECLARQTLVERSVEPLINSDDITSPSKQLGDFQPPDQTGFTGYTLPLLNTDGGCTEDTWTPTSTVNTISRDGHCAVWTGNELIVWGGHNGTYLNTGARYNPTTDSWTITSTTNPPAARSQATAVWSGTEMIVWGGSYQVGTTTIFLSSGGKYNPTTDSWAATTLTEAPTGRVSHTAVWTGSEMIIWGGQDPVNYHNNGARYNPGADSWTQTITTSAPDSRAGHTAIWTGTEMIVWGGGNDQTFQFDNGGRYNPGTNSWLATSTTNAAAARNGHTAVWTGTEMIVWGGSFFDGTFQILNSGGRYNPGTDSWLPTSTINAPTARFIHTAIWTGAQMIIWGGRNEFGDSFNTGAKFSPETDSWMATNTTNAPLAREAHTAVWTGSVMIVWGGDGGISFNTGGKYCVQSSTPAPTPTPALSPTPTSTPTPTTTPTPDPTPTPTSTPHPTSTPFPAQALNISTRMRIETGNNVLIGGFIVTGTTSKVVAVRGIGPSLAAFGVTDTLADPTLELRGSDGALISANDDWQSDPNQAAQLSALGLGLQDPKESGLINTVQPGSYTAVLTGKNLTSGVGLMEIYDTDSAPTSQLANLSARGVVLTGNDVMIGGFILGGNGNTHVVVRGIGPSLAQFGISDFLADPTLELHDSNGAVLASNDNWQDDQASASQLTALGLAPQNVAESGIYRSLPPGAFTAILAGNSGTGIGLVEIFNVQ